MQLTETATVRARAVPENEPPSRAILIVAPQPFYEDRGTPIATRQLATALASLGFEVDLLAYPVGLDQSLQGVQLLRSPNPWGIRRVPVGFSIRKVALDLWMLVTYRRLLRRRRYAAVHVVEEMAYAAVAFESRGTPLVYDMQSCIPDQLRSHAVFGRRPVQRWLRRLERTVLSRVDAVVCSAGLRAHVNAVCPTAQVTELMYVSAAAPPDPAEASKWRTELGVPESARIVLYSGTFEPYQGLDLLVEAMPAVLATHPDTVFVLVGATRERPLPESDLVRGLRQSGRLHVLPRVERHLIPSYHAMADVLVSARSRGENAPLKIFDYMAAGKPIVATDIRAHRAVLDTESAVLVDVSAAALAGGIRRVLDDPELAQSLSHRAQHLAGRGAGAASFDELVAAVYKDVCGIPASAQAIPTES